MQKSTMPEGKYESREESQSTVNHYHFTVVMVARLFVHNSLLCREGQTEAQQSGRALEVEIFTSIFLNLKRFFLSMDQIRYD